MCTISNARFFVTFVKASRQCLKSAAMCSSKNGTPKQRPKPETMKMLLAQFLSSLLLISLCGHHKV